MKIISLLLVFASQALAATFDATLAARLKLGEAIFAERFSPAQIERMLSRNVRDELSQLEKGAGAEYVAKVRKILTDVAVDISTSTSFKDGYTGWIATQLSKAELEGYLEFLRSDLGKKVVDLEARAQPLFYEAMQRRSKGRLESIPLLMAEARIK